MAESDQRSKRVRGITLLEVLISCGLLVIGLTSMAAMLPAAGSRLAQASLEDRAAVIASNALAELKNRGLISAAMFPSTNKVVVFGPVLESLPHLNGGGIRVKGQLQDPPGTPAEGPPNAQNTSHIGDYTNDVAGDAYLDAAEHRWVCQGPGTYIRESGVVPPSQGAAWFMPPAETAIFHCGSPRTFLLEDELVYGTDPAVATPINAFGDEAAGGIGPRRYRRAMCWGATLAPRIFPATAGAAAVLTVPVFKKTSASAIQPIVLTKTSGHYEADLVSPGSLLRACSWVIAIPADPDDPPTWFKVMASWILEPPASQVPRIVFRDPQREFERLTASGSEGQRATVIAFEGLVRVDEHQVVLE